MDGRGAPVSPLLREVVRAADDRRIALVEHAVDCPRCGLIGDGVVRVRRCKKGQDLSVAWKAARVWSEMLQFYGEIDA
jgi:hypothetical protein